MNYEIVNLPEKRVVGVTARTKNSDPDMPVIIGGLWNHFYQDGIYSKITHKTSDKSLGIYSDYENDFLGEYDITVGYEVSNDSSVLPDTILKIIPSGRYAKFVVKGHMQKAVADFWSKLWEMNLDRSYQCDFEEYQNSDMENAEIHIYISLKE